MTLPRECLQEALIITKLHKEVLTGDYARVLNKLSKVLGKRGTVGGEIEAYEKEAQLIRLSRLVVLPSKETDDEKLYNDMVYTLWGYFGVPRIDSRM